MFKLSKKSAFIISVAMHITLGCLLLMSFERTIIVPAEPGENKKIIDAVMISKKSLQSEVARLEAIENQKKAAEQERQQALLRQENEAKERRQREELAAIELKKKNEELKKVAEIELKEREKKIKLQQEELKKIQKQKEEALALKKKAEQQKKIEEDAKQVAKQEAIQKELAQKKLKEAQEQEQQQQQSNLRVKQDQITQHAILMRNKIQQNWRQPLGMNFSGFTCKVAVRLLPTGEVIDVQVVQSSGSVEFDRSTDLAVRKASPLPMPSDQNIANEFRHFTITFSPPEAV